MAGTCSGPGSALAASPSPTSTYGSRRPVSSTTRGSSEMDIERQEYDVLVIGAGGAGVRAAIAAAEHGARTALVCKSLLGKAHTVIAEGGVAAAFGNVDAEDTWQIHF